MKDEGLFPDYHWQAEALKVCGMGEGLVSIINPWEFYTFNHKQIYFLLYVQLPPSAGIWCVKVKWLWQLRF